MKNIKKKIKRVRMRYWHAVANTGVFADNTVVAILVNNNTVQYLCKR